ncbi:MAG: insulinase family protein [Oscillospiraceae bacterium]|jgi:predicted Zn-dependent peptidase|nr:insulinase family protein [Oscillospiraceae bacterium]
MPSISVTAIAPGVVFCPIRTDRFKTSSLSLQLALPLRRDPKRTSANALLPYLLHRSCAAYPTARALNSRLEELYGAHLSAQVTKVGETHWLSLAVTSIDDRFTLADQSAANESVAVGCASLLLEMLFHPVLERDGCFPAQAVEQEKRLLLELRESDFSDKRAYALHRMEEIMFAREAFGQNRFGEAEAIASLTPAEVTQVWRDLLREAKMQFLLVAAGTEEAAAVEAALRNLLAGKERAPAALGSEFISDAGEEKYVREELPVEQGKLVLGFRTDMKDFRDRARAMWVMADLFGGGPYAKLFANVREKMSLCYYCAARLTRYKGILTVQCGIETDKEAAARNAILAQLEEIRQGGFTQEELDTAVCSLCDSLCSLADTPGELADWYAMSLLTGDYLPPEEVCAELRGVTKEDVVAAARGVKLDTVYMLAAKTERENGKNREPEEGGESA